MTMAAEIKNRVGPPAAAQPGAAGIRTFNAWLSCFYQSYMYISLSKIRLAGQLLKTFITFALIRCEDRFKASGGEQGRRLLLENFSSWLKSSQPILFLLRNYFMSQKRSARFGFRRRVFRNIQKYNIIIWGPSWSSYAWPSVFARQLDRLNIVISWPVILTGDANTSVPVILFQKNNFLWGFWPHLSWENTLVYDMCILFHQFRPEDCAFQPLLSSSSIVVLKSRFQFSFLGGGIHLFLGIQKNRRLLDLTKILYVIECCW